jgi:hypothetical protein
MFGGQIAVEARAENLDGTCFRNKNRTTFGGEISNEVRFLDAGRVRRTSDVNCTARFSSGIIFRGFNAISDESSVPDESCVCIEAPSRCSSRGLLAHCTTVLETYVGIEDTFADATFKQIKCIVHPSEVLKKHVFEMQKAGSFTLVICLRHVAPPFEIRKVCTVFICISNMWREKDEAQRHVRLQHVNFVWVPTV